MAQGKSIPRNFTLYEPDMATLHQVGKDNGLASMSAALRWLINDWKRMKAQQLDILAESRAQYMEQSR